MEVGNILFWPSLDSNDVLLYDTVKFDQATIGDL